MEAIRLLTCLNIGNLSQDGRTFLSVRMRNTFPEKRNPEELTYMSQTSAGHIIYQGLDLLINLAGMMSLSSV
jgi:hypothetical protein